MSALYVLYAFGLAEETVVNLPYTFQKRVTEVSELEAVAPALHDRHVLITTEPEAVKIARELGKLVVFIAKHGVDVEPFLADKGMSVLLTEDPAWATPGRIQEATIPLFKPVTGHG